MRKIIAFTLIMTCLSFVISCDKTETYADKLKKESKAIKRLKSDSSFVFIDDYPEDRVFKTNEFYRDPKSGVYFHVIDSGNGNRAVKGKTTVDVRYKWGYFFVDLDTAYQWKNTNIPNDLLSFTYNNSYPASYLETSSSNGSSNYYVKSYGIASVLEHVGEGAVVKMIIPFSSGSYYQQYIGYEPLYLGWVRFQFRRDQE